MTRLLPIALLLLLVSSVEARPVRRCAPVLRHAGPHSNTPKVTVPNQAPAGAPNCTCAPDVREAGAPPANPCNCGKSCQCDPCDCCRCEVCRCGEEKARVLAKEFEAKDTKLKSAWAEIAKLKAEARRPEATPEKKSNLVPFLIGIVLGLLAWCVGWSLASKSKPRLGSWCIFLALLGCATVAQASSPVALVGRERGGGASDAGVGTLVATENGKGVVVSCWHIFNEARGTCWVEFGGHQRMRATLVNTDATLDIAALTIDNPPDDIKPLPLASFDEIPRSGDTVEFIGNGGGNWRKYQVKVSGYTPRLTMHGADQRHGNSQLVTQFSPISGDSGGPLIFKGKLVAINWGGPSEGNHCLESHGTHSDQISYKLTQWGCPGGNCGPRGGGGYAQPAYQGPVYQQPAAQPPSPSQAAQQPPMAPVKPKREVVKGERGEQGPQGERGPAGEAPKLDDIVKAVVAELDKRPKDKQPTTAEIADAVKDKLGFSLVFEDDRGDVFSEQQIKLGGELRIPAVTVRNYDRNNRQLGEQKYPLPSPIKLRHGVVAKQ